RLARRGPCGDGGHGPGRRRGWRGCRVPGWAPGHAAAPPHGRDALVPADLHAPGPRRLRAPLARVYDGDHRRDLVDGRDAHGAKPDPDPPRAGVRARGARAWRAGVADPGAPPLPQHRGDHRRGRDARRRAGDPARVLHQLPRVRHPTAVRELGKHAQQCAELLCHGAVGRDLSGRDDHRGGDELQLSRRRAPRRAGPAPRALACLRTWRAPRGDGTMADTADVIVVGGGVNGASIAWALASQGVGRVVLCEKGALASGASGRSSALVRMHYTTETDARLACASFALFRHWRPVTKILRRESRVTGVETSTGGIDAGAVVVAAGAWAPRLCREIGLELPARVKGIDTVVVTRPAELARPHVIFIDNVQGSY